MLDNPFSKKKHRDPASIKGVFVHSHIEALRKKKGEPAVDELKRRFGKPTDFSNVAKVPVHDEVAIVEIALDLQTDEPLTGSERAKAAGRLHFTNFSETALGSTLMGSFTHTPQSFKTLLHNAPSVARVVFSNTKFVVEESGEVMTITIDNCDYPIEHFQGFFEEWMRYWGLSNTTVMAQEVAEGVYQYKLNIQNKKTDTP